MRCHDCQTVLSVKRPNTKRCHDCRRKYKAARELAKRRANGALPRGERRISRICNCCQVVFQAQRTTAKWCPSCSVWKARILQAPPICRQCRWCGKKMEIRRGKHETSGERFCSDDCRRNGARRSKLESAKRMARGEEKRPGGRPNLLTPGDAVTRKREGLAPRFFRRNPDRPRVCQGCGEKRIVELAHKSPRNGAWRSLARNTQSDHVWVLCPTCHKCLDYGIETIESLGLA